MLLFLTSLGGAAQVRDSVWEAPRPGVPALQCFKTEVFQKFRVDYLQISSFAEAGALARRPTGTGAVAWLLSGRVPCGRRTQVLQAIGGHRRAEGVLKQLEDHWPNPGFSPGRPSVKAYLAAVSRSLARGETLAYLYDPAGKVYVRQGKDPWLTFDDPDLHLALLYIAFQRQNPTERASLEADLLGLEARLALPTKR